MLLVGAGLLAIGSRARADFDPSGYLHRAVITFGSYTEPEVLHDFPVLIKLGEHIPGFAYSQFQTPEAGDLRFVANDTELSDEIDTWDPPGNSLIWVRVTEPMTPEGSCYRLMLPAKDFTLSPAPAVVSFPLGSFGGTTVVVTPTGGFRNLVTLAVSGLPGGGTPQLSPAAAFTSASLSFEVDPTASPGTFPVTVTGTSGNLIRSVEITLTTTAPSAGAAFAWPACNPDLNYDFGIEYPDFAPPTEVLDDCPEVVETITSEWWCFRYGPDKNPLVTAAAWNPVLERMDSEFAYFRDVMGWPPDKRAQRGYYSSIYLFGSGGSVAWIWQYCPTRVLEGLASTNGGLGPGQTRRLIKEFRARQAMCAFGRWSPGYANLLNGNWRPVIHVEYAPVWINCDPWTAICYVATTNNAGTCRLNLAKPVRNNVVVAVICNTDYAYTGDALRSTKFDYRLLLAGSAVAEPPAPDERQLAKLGAVGLRNSDFHRISLEQLRTRLDFRLTQQARPEAPQLDPDAVPAETAIAFIGEVSISEEDFRWFLKDAYRAEGFRTSMTRLKAELDLTIPPPRTPPRGWSQIQLHQRHDEINQPNLIPL